MGRDDIVLRIKATYVSHKALRVYNGEILGRRRNIHKTSMGIRTGWIERRVTGKRKTGMPSDPIDKLYIALYSVNTC